MNTFETDLILRILSHGVYSYDQLFDVFRLHYFVSPEDFYNAFLEFSKIYLASYQNKYRHIYYKPIFYLDRKYFLRKIPFKFHGFDDFVYFLSCPDLNLFHDFLSDQLSSYFSRLNVVFLYNKSFAGSRIAYDFLLPDFNIALEVETGLKGGNYFDLDKRLGISPLHDENINKRFLNSPFIYILVPNDLVKKRYFKHYLFLSDKLGFSVSETYKFKVLTFNDFESVKLLNY